MPRNFIYALIISAFLHLVLVAGALMDWGSEKKTKPLPKHINASLVITPNKQLEAKKKQAQLKKRKADAAKKAATAKKIKEQKRKAEAAKKAAAAKKIKEQKRKADIKRKADAAKKKAAAKKLKEQKRKADAAKKKAQADKKRKADAAKKKAAAKKLAAQKRKAEAAKKKAAAEKKRKAQAEKKRQAEVKAKRQAAAAAEQQALEDALLNDTLAEEDAEIQAQEDYFQAQQHSALIRKSISVNWRRPPNARNDMVVVLEIELLPNGDLRKVSVLESSGNEQFDASAVNAVNKTRRFSAINSLPSSVFETYFRRFKLKFSPEDLRL